MVVDESDLAARRVSTYLLVPGVAVGPADG